MQIPVADDARASGGDRFDHVHHQVVWVQREEQVRPDGEVLDALRVGLRHALQPRALMGPLVETHRERLADERLPATLPPAACRDVFAEVVRRQGVQLRVDARTVVALGVVLDEDLPVRGDVVDLARGAPQRREVESSEDLHEIVEVVEERLGVRVQREEDEALPGLAPHLGQRVVGRVEALQVVGVLRLQQRAVRCVDPGVVRADDLLRLAAVGLAVERPLDQRGAAVPAGVDEGVEHVVFAARDDHLFAGELQEAVGADVRRLLLATDAAPLMAEDLLGLPGEDRRVVIDARREHVRLVERAPHGSDAGGVQGCRSRRLQHVSDSPTPLRYLMAPLRRTTPPKGSRTSIATRPSRPISARPRLSSLP